ncbi:MAG: hypothetical protein JOY80_13110, partial [Candidatus Dormibacteraeota bacterium]|nr:hypothetical protein [Candidatus Dormibacteraeota bacterium]
SRAMAAQRPRQRPSTPFVTRRSTLAFSASCVAASFAFQSLLGSNGSASGPSLLLALSGAVALVSGTVAWIEGVVLALRAGSLLWTVIAALPVPPLNSVVCAMFCPAGPGERRR